MTRCQQLYFVVDSESTDQSPAELVTRQAQFRSLRAGSNLGNTIFAGSGGVILYPLLKLPGCRRFRVTYPVPGGTAPRYPSPLGMDTAKLSSLKTPLRCTPDFHDFTNLFSHGFDHPTKSARYLVEQRHFFLRNAPGCDVRHLPSSPIYCSWCSPRRDHCVLSAGNVWVRISVLGVKLRLS